MKTDEEKPVYNAKYMFEGFDDPKENWSRLPHKLINALNIISTEGECKVILYILRHTWGFGDDEKKITLDEFCKGRKRRDGSRIDNGTGMSVNSVRQGLIRAVNHGFIIHEKDDSDKAREKHYFSLRMSKSDSLESEVNNLESDSDTRSEKETISNKPLRKKNPIDGQKPPVKPAPDNFKKEFQPFANLFIKRSGLSCKTMTDYTFWLYGSKTKPNTYGFKRMLDDGFTVTDMQQAFDYIEAHNRKASNRNNQIHIKAPCSIYTYVAKMHKQNNGNSTAQEDEEVTTF